MVAYFILGVIALSIAVMVIVDSIKNNMGKVYPLFSIPCLVMSAMFFFLSYVCS